MSYRLVLFDYDGTLADSFPWLLSVINQVASQYHLPRVEPNDYETLRRLDARQMIRSLGFSFWKIPLIARDMRKLAARDIQQIPLFAGVDRLLRGLSDQGVRLGIVSSNSSENIQQVLGPDIAGLIRDYECDVSVFGKAARLRKILRQSGVACKEVIFIGDEFRDLEAARKAGVAFGAVAWGYASIDALQARSPDEVFMSMDELLAKFDLL